MARLTFDAIAIQSVIGAGESVTILEAAQRAFCPDQTGISQVALLRARRACHVLRERGLLDVNEKGVSLRSADLNGAAALQLSAVITRTILAAHESDGDEPEESDTGAG
jgi:hypothetical protein